jgi:hypothetical protein
MLNLVSKDVLTSTCFGQLQQHESPEIAGWFLILIKAVQVPTMNCRGCGSQYFTTQGSLWVATMTSDIYTFQLAERFGKIRKTKDKL